MTQVRPSRPCRRKDRTGLFSALALGRCWESKRRNRSSRRQAGEAGFTNEAGLGGTTRLLKNIVGLWIVQECRRALGGGQGRIILMKISRVWRPRLSRSFRSSIQSGNNSPSPIACRKRWADYCANSGQEIPETPGALVRCVYESLALRYGRVLKLAEELTGRRAAPVAHRRRRQQERSLQSDRWQTRSTSRSSQGQSKRPPLATCLSKPWLSATSPRMRILRSIVKASFPGKTFSPRPDETWQKASEKFGKLTYHPA